MIADENVYVRAESSIKSSESSEDYVAADEREVVAICVLGIHAPLAERFGDDIGVERADNVGTSVYVRAIGLGNGYVAGSGDIGVVEEVVEGACCCMSVPLSTG